MKKGLAILICISLLLGIFSTNIFADEKSGTCGEGVTWNFESGILTISGSGEVEDQAWGNWHRHEIAIVVIEEGITGIGENAFVTCNLLCNIELPDSLEYIDSGVFNGCVNLPMITLPDKLKTIGSVAFQNCDNLSTAIIPNSVISIGLGAFRFCDNLRSAVIGSGVISMGNEIFRGCTSLSEITIGKSVKLIGNNAFEGCEALKTVNYCGSKEEWKKVVINEGNEALNNAKINYNYGGETKNDDVFDSITTEITIGESNNSKSTAEDEGEWYIAENDTYYYYGPVYFSAIPKDTNSVKPIKEGEEIYVVSKQYYKNQLWHKAGNGYYVPDWDIAESRRIILSGPDSAKSIRVIKGNRFVLNNEYTPKFQGYTFIGWGMTPESTSPAYRKNDTLTVNDDINLYAIFEKNANECTTHTYKSAMGDVCTVCGYKYEPTLTKYENTMEAITANTAVRKAPYAKSGEIVRKLAAGTEVKVTHFLKNSLGNTWYLTEDGYYIYKENLTVKRVYYTLSYNANGGSGVPDKLEVRAGSAVKIHLNIPTRSGYSFKGWAKNRNGSVSYQPGAKLILTDNITLYAVWEKNNSVLEKVPGIAQNQYGTSGTCTTAATAVMLARRLVVDKKSETFNFLDVRKSCYEYYGKSTFGVCNMSNRYTENGSTTYSLKKETLSSLRGNADKMTEYIVGLLDKHPEGIVFYYNYGNNNSGHHAILLSDYEVLSNGKYQFYAYDSASSNELGRKKLEETYSWKKNFNGYTYKEFFLKANDGHKCFTDGTCVWYVNKEVR